MSRKIRIIINPNSGTKFSDSIKDDLTLLIEEEGFVCDIQFTIGPTHAYDLSQEAAELNYYAVIAVGGDGTLNETAAALVKTNTLMGVIPTGSGNGFARHIGMHLNPAKAVKQLIKAKPLAIDVCYVNKKAFFNVAGIGFDALVAHDFSLKPDRGFISYLGSALKFWLTINNTKYKLKLDGHKVITSALMISFANGSQFGNNATIAPAASLTDGYMQVCILKKFPVYRAPLLAYRLFSGNIPNSKFLKILRVKKVIVKRTRKKIHLDGEPFTLSKKLKVEVVPNALNILAPLEYFEAHEPKHSIG